MAQAIKLQKSGKYVFIEAIKVEEAMANKMIKIQMPRIKGDQNTYNPGTGIVDLKRIEHIYNITGFISYSANTHLVGTCSNATDVKNYLIKNVLNPSGNIELYYRGQGDDDYGSYYWDNSAAESGFIRCVLDKFLIQDVGTRGRGTAAAPANSPERYNITLNLTRGKVK